MGIEMVWNALVHLFRWVFASKEEKESTKMLSKFTTGNQLPEPGNEAVQKKIAEVKAETTKEAEAVNEAIYQEAAPTKEQRLKRILDLIVNQVLVQGYTAPENKELNPIHPHDAKYILTLGAAMASEFTEQTAQRLAKTKGFEYAEWHIYEAISAQWRREYAYLVTEAGKTVPSRVKEKIRASLNELWRQTVWADPAFADDFIVRNRITESELHEFLLAMAEDDVGYLPKTDKPVVA